MELLQRKLKNAVELYSQVSLVVRRKWLQKAKMNMLRCALVHMYVYGPQNINNESYSIVKYSMSMEFESKPIVGTQRAIIIFVTIVYLGVIHLVH